MIIKVLKRTFWLFYDNLLKAILINLSLFAAFYLTKFILVIFIPNARLRNIVGALILGIIWCVMCPAILSYWAKVLRSEENSGAFKEIISGIKNFSLQGTAMFFINAMVAALAIFSIMFYKQTGAGTQGAIHVGAVVMAGIGFFMALVFGLMQLYVMPILVLDEKKRILVSYKKAFIMSFSAPVTALIVAVVIAVMVVPVVMVLIDLPLTIFHNAPVMILAFMPFVTFVIVMMLMINTTILIYEKHKIFEQDLTEEWEDRSLSNLLRPWETKK